nr:MAG TPA: hypothetical protein [Caudoviricetes sp.]
MYLEQKQRVAMLILLPYPQQRYFRTQAVSYTFTSVFRTEAACCDVDSVAIPSTKVFQNTGSVLLCTKV